MAAAPRSRCYFSKPRRQRFHVLAAADGHAASDGGLQRTRVFLPREMAAPKASSPSSPSLGPTLSASKRTGGGDATKASDTQHVPSQDASGQVAEGCDAAAASPEPKRQVLSTERAAVSLRAPRRGRFVRPFAPSLNPNMLGYNSGAASTAASQPPDPEPRSSSTPQQVFTPSTRSALSRRRLSSTPPSTTSSAPSATVPSTEQPSWKQRHLQVISKQQQQQLPKRQEEEARQLSVNLPNEDDLSHGRPIGVDAEGGGGNGLPSAAESTAGDVSIKVGCTSHVKR